MDERPGQLNDDAAMERFRESRRRLLAEDPLLPAYHFSPPEGWLNDPNGLCFWQGRYHLFYQFRPEGESRVHWGHTVSGDLIHWSDLPPAISPEIEDCCFSGTTCVEADRVTALYYGTKQGSMVAASRDPLLLNWEKHPGNPVIPAADIDETGYRGGGGDPCIWKEEGAGYFALVGGRGRESADLPFHLTARLFFSQDLGRWVYLGRFFDDQINTTPHDDGACPNFCPLGDKHLFCYFSHKSSSGYFIGDYDRTPESMDVQLEEDRIIDCRIFVDRSIVEVFVNGQQCVTLRVHPSRPDSTGISLRAQGGAALVKKMIVHQMRSIWE